MSALERKHAIRDNLRPHAKIPTGWATWPIDKCEQFKADCERVFELKGSLTSIRESAQRLAGHFGVPFATIDPEEQP